MWTQQDVTHEIAIRFPMSLQIAIMATFVSVIIAVPLGVISAAKQNTLVDYFVRAISIAGIAMPSFWLGIVIILGLLIATRRGPAFRGCRRFFTNRSGSIHAQLVTANMASPGNWLSVFFGCNANDAIGNVGCSTRGLCKDCSSKRVDRKIIVNKHALKNAMLPVVTVIGIEFAFLMGGLVVTEQVFNLNGVGKLFVESVTQADYTLTQSLVMLVVFIFVMVNFVVDLMYAWLDPRIRYS